MQNNPTTASLPPQFEHFASVASSTPASLDQAANPGMEEFPGREELMLDYDRAAEFLRIHAELLRTNRDEMNCGGPGAPGPVIAYRPNPPCANQQKKNTTRKVQANAPDSDEQTDAPDWSEISMGGRDFDVHFLEGGAMILSTTLVAPDCAGAPRPSKKMPKKKKTQEEKKAKTPSLRS